MPGKPEKDDQVSFLKKVENKVKWCFRPTWSNARNWFAVCIFALLGVALLGSFLPLVPAIIAAKIFAMFVAFPVSIFIAATAILRHYNDVRKGRTAFSLFSYAKEILPNWLGKSPRNIVQFAFGCILFSLVACIVLMNLFPFLQTGLLDIIPGLQPAFDLMGICIHFFQAGFNVTMLTSPLGVSVFLGVALLTGYDLLCRVIKAIFPIEGEDRMESRKGEGSLLGEDEGEPLDRFKEKDSGKKPDDTYKVLLDDEEQESESEENDLLSTTTNVPKSF